MRGLKVSGCADLIGLAEEYMGMMRDYGLSLCIVRGVSTFVRGIESIAVVTRNRVFHYSSSD